MRSLLVAVSLAPSAAGAVLVLVRLTPEGRPPQPRLVLLYATCSVNRDFLSPYNAAVDFTPELAEFPRGGSVFLRHWSEAGQSGIAFASIFSGTQAPECNAPGTQRCG